MNFIGNLIFGSDIPNISLERNDIKALFDFGTLVSMTDLKDNLVCFNCLCVAHNKNNAPRKL